MIIQADSRKIPLPPDCVDLVVTSPPYFNAREYSSWATYSDYLYDMRLVITQCYRVLKDGGRIAVNVPHGYGRPGNGGYMAIGEHMTELIEKQGFELRGHIVWTKVGMSPQSKSTSWGSWMSASNPALRDEHEIIIVAHKGNAKLEPVGESTIDRETFLEATKSVWEIRPVAFHKWHPATYPTEIPRRLIELYSYRSSVVLDPFSGAGTTVMVATKLGRIGVGIELNYRYADLSNVELMLDNFDWDESHIKWLLLKKKLSKQKDLAAGGSLGVEGLPLWSKGD